MVEKIYNMILETLKKALDEGQFNEIKYQISEKFVKPVDQKSIINFEFGEKKGFVQSIHDGINNVTNTQRNTSSTGYQI